MTQQNLFPGLAPAVRTLKGDHASSANHYLWAVEVQVDRRGVWIPLRLVSTSRADARSIARRHRAVGKEVRVVPYKACIDSKGRHNRQVTSERLDA